MTELQRAGGEPLDVRLLLLGLAVWLGCLAGRFLPPLLLLVGAGAVAAGLLFLLARGRLRPLGASLGVLALVAVVVTVMRIDVVGSDRLPEVVGSGGHLSARAVVTSDPVVRNGRFGQYVVVHLRLRAVEAHGQWRRANAAVLGFVPPSWSDVPLGATVLVSGTYSESDRPDLAGTLAVRRPAEVLSGPVGVLRAASWVRQGIRGAASVSHSSARELVPALVVGDDAGLDDRVVENFRISGLTHLTAVSGTNLTLVVGFLLAGARALGVRGRLLLVVGALGVVGFVLAARPEPSVLRAAVMGSVALAGMWSGSVNRGVRALGAALLLLLLIDPWLAASVGFALSALATAGILVVAPPVVGQLSLWLPRWLAEAIAVPFAAQVACTPLIAAISGQVSLVAVVANLLAGVAVGPATVLGMLGGVIVGVFPAGGHLLGRLACWSADWIILMADRAARLPGAAVGWPTGLLGLLALTVVCLVLIAVAPRLASRPVPTLAAVALVAVFLLHPIRLGWAPDGWFFVVCDVGQGDGLVLRVGESSAVVVDTGPDPVLMRRCLDGLGITTVPLVVLTHFHADHVDGLDAVLEHRDVGEIWVSGTSLPSQGAGFVAQEAARAGVPVTTPDLGAVVTLGDVTLQVVSPGSEPRPGVVAADLGSTPNNASIVLSVTTEHVSLLLGGDVEPEAQRGLANVLAGRTYDVLKVPHHGSAHQDLDFLKSLGARVALISVGIDNDYGHPDPDLVSALRSWGMTVARTDLDGALALTWDGELRLVRQGP